MARAIPLWALLASSALAGGQYYEHTEAASDRLPIGVTFTLWVPEGVSTLRGVIVHQHGCGTGACKGGETAAYDLHWQALARKHRCALLGPSYKQEDKQNCRLWCDPRNGSGDAFLRALKQFATDSKHPELTEVPWCLWGHSGGGFWASLIHAQYPQRVVACWLRSGTAFTAWTKGEVPAPTLAEAVYSVPVMLNPGLKEKGDKRFAGAWNGSVAMFDAYRAKGAPIALAPDPRTSHECGDSRYLAIPFFDVCLTGRLAEKGNKLRAMPTAPVHLATDFDSKPVPVERFKGEANRAHWLPNAAFAAQWKEYVAKGSVGDSTPPPAPHNVQATAKDGVIVVTWQAEADFESGLRGFILLRDGKEVAQVPEKPIGRFGRPLFQTMSYHDTPEKPLPAMRWVDKAGTATSRYEVIAINSVGLRSKPGR
jgi:hypothetical protein